MILTPFPLIQNSPKPRKHQNWAKHPRVAWWVFITANEFIRKTQNGVTCLCRLAVQGFPRGNLENTPKTYESPSGYA